ncbi:MAG: hypothetical protein AAF598_13640 [Bacteroidota bacterium]
MTNTLTLHQSDRYDEASTKEIALATYYRYGGVEEDIEKWMEELNCDVQNTQVMTYNTIDQLPIYIETEKRTITELGFQRAFKSTKRIIHRIKSEK